MAYGPPISGFGMPDCCLLTAPVSKVYYSPMGRTKKTKNAAAQALGRQGGLASRRALTATQRTLRARRAALARHGRLRPVTRQWLAFDPLKDNPPVVLFSSPDRRKVEHWALANSPQAFITSLDTQFLQRATVSVGEVERKYEPNTARQLAALKTLVEVAEG